MLGRVATWPLRVVVRKLCEWKLDELRRYESALVKLARSPQKIAGERLDELGRMLKQVREEIAMLERQRGRAA